MKTTKPNTASKNKSYFLDNSMKKNKKIMTYEQNTLGRMGGSSVRSKRPCQ